MKKQKQRLLPKGKQKPIDLEDALIAIKLRYLNETPEQREARRKRFEKKEECTNQ